MYTRSIIWVQRLKLGILPFRILFDMFNEFWTSPIASFAR